MSRLPIPGADDNTWGDVLNDYLQVEHNTDGTLKSVARPSELAAIGLTETAVKTANYTAAAGDLVPVDASSSAVTVTLPAATAGLRVAVRKNAGTNTLTIAAAGVDVMGSGSATSATDMVVGEVRMYRVVPAGGRWQIAGGWRPSTAAVIAGASDLTNASAVTGQVVAVTATSGGVATQFGLVTSAPVLLIANAAALPAGTPAGTIVVVKS